MNIAESVISTYMGIFMSLNYPFPEARKPPPVLHHHWWQLPPSSPGVRQQRSLIFANVWKYHDVNNGRITIYIYTYNEPVTVIHKGDRPIQILESHITASSSSQPPQPVDLRFPSLNRGASKVFRSEGLMAWQRLQLTSHPCVSVRESHPVSYHNDVFFCREVSWVATFGLRYSNAMFLNAIFIQHYPAMFPHVSSKIWSRKNCEADSKQSILSTTRL